VSRQVAKAMSFWTEADSAWELKADAQRYSITRKL